MSPKMREKCLFHGSDGIFLLQENLLERWPTIRSDSVISNQVCGYQMHTVTHFHHRSWKWLDSENRHEHWKNEVQLLYKSIHTSLKFIIHK